MALSRIDFSQDYVIFLIAMIVLLSVLAAALARASPKRKTRRRVDQSVRDRGGELIE